MENSAFIRSNPSAGRTTANGAAPVVRAEPVSSSRTVLTGTLRTATVPSERVTATPVSAPARQTTQTTANGSSQSLRDAFAEAEAQRVAAGDRAAQTTANGAAQSLRDAFAEAEAQRVAAGDRAAQTTANGSAQSLRDAFAEAEAQRVAANGRTRPCRCGDHGAGKVPNPEALDAALLRGTGWGKDAGGTLTLTSAASMLLDWGEDNNAARLELEPLTAYIRVWLETLDCCLAEHFRENWPNISDFGDRLVADVAPHTGRLADAGSPNRRTNYSPVPWAAVKEAVEQAVNGAEDGMR